MAITLDRSPQDVGDLLDQLNSLRTLIVAAIARCAFGEITITAGVTAITMTVQNTWYQITADWVADQRNNTVLDAAAGHITFSIAGQYWTMGTISFTSGASAQTIEFGMFRNGTLVSDHVAVTWIDSATYPNTVSISGIDAFEAGDVIDIRVRCTTAAGIAITPTRANFSVASIGGALR